MFIITYTLTAAGTAPTNVRRADWELRSSGELPQSEAVPRGFNGKLHSRGEAELSEDMGKVGRHRRARDEESFPDPRVGKTLRSRADDLHFCWSQTLPSHGRPPPRRATSPPDPERAHRGGDPRKVPARGQPLVDGKRLTEEGRGFPHLPVPAECESRRFACETRLERPPASPIGVDGAAESFLVVGGEAAAIERGPLRGRYIGTPRDRVH